VFENTTITGKTVLIVGIDQHIRRLIQVNLEREGCHVEMVKYRVDAMNEIETWRPYVVFMDIFDIALAHELRSSAATCNIEIMLVGPDGNITRL